MLPLDEVVAYVLIFALVAIPFFQFCFARNLFIFFLIPVITITHYAFLIVFLVISEGQITDSINYFGWAESLERWGFSGTDLVVSIVGTLRKFGFNDYVLLSLIFCTLSHIGILMPLRAVTRLSTKLTGRRAPLFLVALFFMPGLHLWTAPIGKDSLSIFLLGVGLSTFLESGKVFAVRVIVCVCILFLIRPHVGAPLIIGLTFYLYFTRMRSTSVSGVIGSSVAFFAILFIGSAFFYIYSLDFVQKYSPAGFSSLNDFIESRSDVYKETSSGIDLSTVPLFVKPLFFIFGTVPCEIGSLQQAANFGEGGLIFALTIYGFKLLARRTYSDCALAGRGAFLFLTGLTLIVGFSLIAGNAGLAARMRAIPAFFILLGIFLLYINRSSRKRKSSLKTSLIRLN